MARITFEKFPGLKGRLESGLTMRIFPTDVKQLEVIKKKLTVTNKSAKYKLGRAKKSLNSSFERLRGLDTLNTPKESEVYQKMQAKIDSLRLEIADLETKVTEYFYEEGPNGTLEVPAGFWWLCDRVEGNQHLNTELDKFYLDGLRPYQVESLDELYKYKRATLELATGLGKSKIIASIAMAAVKSNKRIVIVVPTEYLVEQMYYQLKALHPKTTALGGSFKHVMLGWDIIVTTVDSAPKVIDEAQVLVFDEGHHSPAETWMNLQVAAYNATNVYNFTATAFRADGLDLAIHAFGGPIVYSRDARWGLNNGWLCPVKIIQVRMHPKRSDGSPIFYKDEVIAQRAYAGLACNDDSMDYVRDRLLAGLAKGHRIMCIYKTVKAGLALKKWCKGTLDFQVAHANKKLSKNPKLPLKHFNDGKVDLLVACDKLVGEGVDIPNSSMLLLMTQHTSDITTLQVLGRVLRLAEGKEKAVVLDVALSGYAQFDRAADRRLAIYRYLTDDVTVIKA